jgi:WD40 repeat protein
MDLSPDDQRCVIGTTGGFVSLWMLDSNELSEVARLGSEGAPVAVTGLAFHPDGKHIVSASSDRTLRVWRSDGKTMTLSQTVSTAQGETLNCIALSPDGMRLVAAFKSDRESTLGFWTWTEDKQSYGRPARVACAGTVQDVSFSCFGDRVAAGSRDRSIHVFDVEPARPLLSIKGHRTAVNAIAWSHDGERLASGDVDSEVRVWETRESQSWAWSQRDN